MNENNQPENQVINNSIDKEAIMNLANNLTKNETTIDMNSIMKMATNLLTNDTLMNSVKDLGKVKLAHNPESPDTSSNQNQINTELALLKEQLEEITSNLAQIKKELSYINDQNYKIQKFIKKMKK